jgi:hypothetical protein
MSISPNSFSVDSGAGHGFPVGTPMGLSTPTAAASATNGGPGTLSYSWSIQSGSGGTINPGSPNTPQHRSFVVTNTIPTFSQSPKVATVVFQCVVSNSTSGQSVTRTVTVNGAWHHTSGDP